MEVNKISTLKDEGIRAILICNTVRQNFHWTMFYACNANCPYCFQKKEKFNCSKALINDYIKIAKKTIEYIHYYDIKTVYLLGGELSIVPIDEFVKISSLYNEERLEMIRIFSNLTADKSWYKKYLESVIKCQARQIFFSYHRNIYSPKEFFEKLYEVWNEVKDIPNTEILLQYTLSKEQEEIYFDFVKELYLFNKKTKANIKHQAAKEFQFTPKNGGLNKEYRKVEDQRILRFSKNKSTVTSSAPVLVVYNDGRKEPTTTEKLIDSKRNNFQGENCIKGNNITLFNNVLTSHCGQNIITDNFMDSDVSKIPPCTEFKCLDDTCLFTDELSAIGEQIDVGE